MKKPLLTIAIILLASMLAAACTQEKQKPANIAALVNGELIIIEDLHDWINQREIEVEVQKRLSEQYNKNQIEIPEELRTDFEKFLIDMNATPSDLSADQETYLKSHYMFFMEARGSLTDDDLRFIKRSYNYYVPTPDENQALNYQILNLVLYQEAVKQRHRVPKVEAREMYMAVTMPREVQETEFTDEYLKHMEYLKAKHNKYLEIQAEVVQEHGYRSREVYLTKQFPGYVQSLSINRLKNNFLEQMRVEYPNLHGYEYHIKAENAWYDYTESLVRQADIEVLLDGFKESCLVSINCSPSLEELIYLMKDSKGKDGAYAEEHAYKLGNEFLKDKLFFIKAMGQLSDDEQAMVACYTVYNCNYFDIEKIYNETRNFQYTWG